MPAYNAMQTQSAEARTPVVYATSPFASFQQPAPVVPAVQRSTDSAPQVNVQTVVARRRVVRRRAVRRRYAAHRVVVRRRPFKRSAAIVGGSAAGGALIGGLAGGGKGAAIGALAGGAGGLVYDRATHKKTVVK